MTKKSFSASHWFAQNKITINESRDHVIKDISQRIDPFSGILAPFMDVGNDDVKLKSELNRFFVPGWKGESLISKNIKTFVKALDDFQADAFNQFMKNEKFSKRLKLAIFEEFLDFAEFKAIACAGIEDYNDFWRELSNKESEFSTELNHFVRIFSFRIVVIYLLKVRFITSLHEETDINFDIKNIYYPNSFLTSIFRPASSTELKARSFEQNIFSWYRPSSNLKNDLLSFKEISLELNITEIIKTISIKSEEILAQKTYYSHAISHKQFGLYLNSLLLNFPIWKNTLNEKTSCSFKLPNHSTEIISCKYTGDYLESLSLSHWLAQDYKKDLKWDQILCPDFKDSDFESGLYLKHINELQFLTFLAEIAKSQGREPINFICDVINSHLRNRKNSSEVQGSLNLEDSALNVSTYDRVIINLNLYPKNNPQHYLFSKINGQKSYLKDDGLIFVISSKKIFIPSQTNKVEQLLKEFKVEGVFNLESVEGKGEIGNYIYVFSKREEEFKNIPEGYKQACLNFRYTGSLNTFHKFEKLTLLTNQFFQKNLGDLPPIYQCGDTDVRLEFYQDAIIGGQLIHSSTKDSSNITHPGFFKQLMGMCQPLSDLFEFESINFENSKGNDNDNTLFELNNGFERECAEYVFIVDQRSKNEVNLEIINTNLLEAKSYEYGHRLCSYFYAHFKWPDIQLQALQNFFLSRVGKQIINLTFNNELRRVKGNLSKLLAPKFYRNYTQLPLHIEEGLVLLEKKPDEILSLYPKQLEQGFSNLELFLPNLVKDYPCEVLSKLSHFKKSVQKSIDMLGDTNKGGSLNFKNPALMTPLLLAKTNPIYPENPEIFVDFNSDTHNLIHNSLDQIKLTSSKIHGDMVYGIELYHKGEKVLTLFSDEDMTYFLDFLLKQTIGVSISQVLKGIAVPELTNLKSIVDSYKSLMRTIIDVESRLLMLHDRLLSSAILQGN